MKRRKYRGWILIITFLFVLSGCSVAANSTDSDEESVQTYAWPLATASPDNTITNMFAEKFAEEVSSLSDGKMRIEVYPNSTVGGDRELLEMCKDGDIPFVMQSTAPQTSFMTDLSIFDLPLAFSSIEEVRETLDDPVFFDQVSDIYDEAGYKILGYADQNFRVLSSNKLIESVDDFSGIKIRTMENNKHIEFWKGLGANPTPMSFSEVYIALQQGTVDAQENSYAVIVSSKLYEQQDYVIQTNHLPDLISCIVSKKFMESLTQDQQAIIQEAADNAVAYARDLSDERLQEYTETIEASGTQIVALSDETRSQMVSMTQPLYDEIRDEVGDDLYNAYLSAVQSSESSEE